jgi:hypothetical protein
MIVRNEMYDPDEHQRADPDPQRARIPSNLLPDPVNQHRQYKGENVSPPNHRS